MTLSYYNSPEKLAALRIAAAQVVGTPFFANSEAPGKAGGIDCVHGLNWIYRITGAIGPIAIPRQRMDHGQHSKRSLLIEAFDTWPELTTRFACIWRAPADTSSADLKPPTSDFLPGDALCFLAGHVPHHGGLLLESGDLLHVLKRDGAHTIQLTAVIRGWRILGHLAAVYRPLPLASP